MAKALINGKLLRWARERADMPAEELAKKVGQPADRLAKWEEGTEAPTFKQALRLATVTHVPFGYLFLPEPPEEEVPLPDLRTLGGESPAPLDINARDLLQDVLFKHGWFVDYLVEQGHAALPFVGKFTANSDRAEVAADIRQTLHLGDAAQNSKTWEEYVRRLIDHAEAAGVWVMRTGIVGSNTQRPLSTRQFRGFAIADRIAPLIFINGRDALAAQVFTFAHELAHVWLGSSGISNIQVERADYGSRRQTEYACNQIAAEVVLPTADFNQAWLAERDDLSNFDTISRTFKVSRIVAARRALDLGRITEQDYSEFYRREKLSWEAERRDEESTGGNFFATLPLRNGLRFTKAVVSRAMIGETLLRDAGRLLNIQPPTVVKYFKKASAR
jgi:Zn-dependent peptidase ImmA (M78 family)/DNA-binding XRE family transcriptional regulator